MASKVFKKVIIGGDIAAASKCIRRYFLNATASPNMKSAFRSQPHRCAVLLRAIQYFSSVPDEETQLHFPRPCMEGSLFEEFSYLLEESNKIKERIQNVVLEIKPASELLRSSLLHESGPVRGVLEKANGQSNVLKELFCKLAEIHQESHDCWDLLFESFEDDWRSETRTVVSLLVFKHWLETGCLLSHQQVEKELGLNSLEFSLDSEDYLVGLCLMSNELSVYAVKRVLSGDYDSSKEAFKVLEKLEAQSGMLHLRNDLLCEKFNGMKDNLAKIRDILSDTDIYDRKKSFSLR